MTYHKPDATYDTDLSLHILDGFRRLVHAQDKSTEPLQFLFFPLELLRNVLELALSH
jgi:hypothetical protein